MQGTAPARTRGVLLGRERVPHEVVSLAHREGVVHSVVTEHPGLVDVRGRQHREMTDDGVRALGGEEGAVRAVVGDDEECGHGEDAEDVERHVGPRIGDQHQTGHGEQIDRDVTREVGHALPGGVLVRRVGDDVDDRLE